MVNDAAKLPPKVRKNVASPEPSAIWFGGRSESRMVRVGMKNSATPIPMNNCTMAMCWKSTSLVKPARMKQLRPMARNAPPASRRMSNFGAYLPTNGASSTGRIPSGATAKPAQVAV
ncbi:hypothetical protein D3C87_1568260 [compost metagenome]